MKSLVILFLLLTQLTLANDTYYYKGSQKISLVKQNTLSQNSQNIDYYKNSNNLIFGVTDKIIVKLRESDTVERYLKEYNLSLEKKLSNNMYLLQTKDKNSTITISNILNEKDEIIYAHPDFIKQRVLR